MSRYLLRQQLGNQISEQSITAANAVFAVAYHEQESSPQLFALIDANTGKAVSDVLLTRANRALLVEKEGKIILRLEGFFAAESSALYSPDASMVADQSAIHSSSDIPASTITAATTDENSAAQGSDTAPTSPPVWKAEASTTDERDNNDIWIYAGSALGLGLLANSGSDSHGPVAATPDTPVVIGPTRHEGVVIDGYVRDAIVFADANANGVLDPGELSTTTDDKGNFLLVSPDGSPIKGELISIGGNDIATGTPVEGSFRAPEGANVIGPITTLVSKVMKVGNVDAATAEQMVKSALGIDSTTDLKTFDPIKQATAADATPGQIEQALVTQRIAAQLNTTLGQGGAMLSGSGVSTSESAGQQQILDTMADIIVNGIASGQGFRLDLTDITQTTLILTSAASQAGASASQQAQIDNMATTVATATTNLNRAINDQSQNSSNPLEALKAISAVQIVAHIVKSDTL
ncbi:MAG: hypothetical protein HQL49_13155, partial [Gammaproteobacteria bacterium]|nr:hypothetical protein [Gammaproteobacteria bacterium]